MLFTDKIKSDLLLINMKRQTNYILQVKLTTPDDACIKTTPFMPNDKGLPYPYLPFQVCWYYEVPSEVLRHRQCHVFLQLNVWLLDAMKELQLLVKGPVKTLKACDVITYVQTLGEAQPFANPQGPFPARCPSAQLSQKQTEQLKEYKFELLAEATPPASQSIPRFDGTKRIDEGMFRSVAHHIDSDDDAEKSNPKWVSSDGDDDTEDGVLWHPVDENAARTLRDVNSSAADVLGAITSLVNPRLMREQTFHNETHILHRLGDNNK